MEDETPKDPVTVAGAGPPVDPAAHAEGMHPHLPTSHGGGHGFPIKLPFIEQIKRRNVGRVAVLYVVMAYLVLEVFEMFHHLLELPAWTGRAVVGLAVLGFPAALLFAWAYEVTPEGIKPSERVDPHKSIARQTGRRLDRAIIAVLAVALTYFVADKFWLSKRAVAPEALESSAVGAKKSAHAPTAVVAAIPEKSIAVLPFVDMSEKKDQEYFSDGLSEELIDQLAHNANLKVIARTSSFAFKGKNEDMRTIATKLGVANLLEGSVRKAGNELRITAQLIRAVDGVHLWSESSERKLNDIFNVQEEISTTVVKALKVAPTAGTGQRTRSEPNTEAYNLVLRGNYFFMRGNTGDDVTAVDQYQRALKLAPDYARAWAQLARVYIWQATAGEISMAEGEPKARNAARRALDIDPRSALAHYAMGNIFRFADNDWQAAKLENERVLAVDPYGEVGDLARQNSLIVEASETGNSDGVIRDMVAYVGRNPLDTSVLSDLAWYQQYAGRLEDSAETSRKLLSLNPGFATAPSQYAQTLLLMGHGAEALAAAQTEPSEGNRLEALACIYWTLGQHDLSGQAMHRFDSGFANSHAYLIASVHAWRGDVDAAFAWLDRAYRQRDGWMFLVSIDPLLRHIRKDSRYKALLHKLKLLET